MSIYVAFRIATATSAAANDTALGTASQSRRFSRKVTAAEIAERTQRPTLFGSRTARGMREQMELCVGKEDNKVMKTTVWYVCYHFKYIQDNSSCTKDHATSDVRSCNKSLYSIELGTCQPQTSALISLGWCPKRCLFNRRLHRRRLAVHGWKCYLELRANLS